MRGITFVKLDIFDDFQSSGRELWFFDGGDGITLTLINASTVP
ncbi:MAG: hypothetical protein ACTS4W_00370 [Candidatus Hodgkinia cicadicola]